MNTDFETTRRIFLAIVEQPSAQWEVLLNEACGNDPVLRQQVARLLQAHAKGEGILDRNQAGRTTTGVYESVSERPGTVIGPYKLLQQIGEGGFGTVFMAEQTQPVQRKVALKVIKAGMDSRQIIARFEAERQALAMMDHVNIARVLDAGTTESGLPYFVMELVHGVPITKYCDDNHLTPRERLELFVPVCQAIQHAHQKGIIHRDIKPSNVMITLYDGKPVPKVIDFGVAKATEQKLTEHTLFTQYGTMVGTFEYMSPEQAEMSALGADTRSDIFSLGVLLYELLTGSTPLSHKRLKEAAFGEILRMIKEEEPPKPSTRLSDSGEALASISAQRHMEPAKLTKLVRGELDWIVMKTLEKDRNRRYETASGFAADVQRYLNDEAVQACPPSAAYRFRKFARRNKGAFVTASVLALGVLLGLAGLAVSNILITQEKNEKVVALHQAKISEEEAKTQTALAKQNAKTAAEQRSIAAANEKSAKVNELLAQRRFYSATMNLAHQAWEAGNPPRVLELLESQRPKTEQEDLRSFEWYFLWRLCHQGCRATLRGHRGAVRSVAFFPDGNTMASLGDGEVKLWDLATGRQQGSLASGAGCMAISPDGKTLATGGGTTTLWDVATMKQLTILPAGWVHAVAFSLDGKTLATGTDSGEVALWDVGAAKKLETLRAHKARVLAIAFSRDGKTLATGTGWDDNVTKLWDLGANPPQIIHQLRGAKNGLAFSPDGLSLLIAGWGSATLYDASTGRSTRETALGSGFNSVSAAFSPDGKTLAFGLEERTVKVYDRAGVHLRTYGLLKEVWCVAFSADGKALAAGGDDGVIHLWDVFPEPEPAAPPAAGLHSAAFSPNGETLALGTNDGKVKLWDMVRWQQRMTLTASSSPVCSVAFSPDGKAVASASGGGGEHSDTPGIVNVWNAANGREIATLKGQIGGIWSVAFSRDSRTLASGSLNGSVKLWDLAREQASITLKGARTMAVAFAPDEKRWPREARAGSRSGTRLQGKSRLPGRTPVALLDPTSSVWRFRRTARSWPQAAARGPERSSCGTWAQDSTGLL